MAKKPVIQSTVQTGLVVTTSMFGPMVKVSGMGPLTVAFQVDVSNKTTATGATLQISASIDGIIFFLVGSAVTIATAADYILTDTSPAFAYYRVSFVIATGTYTATTKCLVYGDTI